jgi:phosphotransacetylase
MKHLNNLHTFIVNRADRATGLKQKFSLAAAVVMTTLKGELTLTDSMVHDHPSARRQCL